jgi:hypothetical protein
MHTFTNGQIFFSLIVLAASFMLIHYTITIPMARKLEAIQTLCDDIVEHAHPDSSGYAIAATISDYLAGAK